MNKLIDEIFVLRSTACLAIVFLHAIQSAMMKFNMENDPSLHIASNMLFVLQILMMFGTPMFVFISEFIISYSYGYKTPKSFLIKRVKYILIPYIFMGIFYSIAYPIIHSSTLDLKSILMVAYKNVFMGYYHGYFVLIIFQFYLLHNVFSKYIATKYSWKLVVSVSILINVIYLSFFNFVEPTLFFSDITSEIEDLWYVILYRLPFFAWLSYFTVAYYCGRNIKKFLTFIKTYSKFVILAPLITGGIVMLLCVTGILQFMQSKRVDIIFYTLSCTFFLFYFAQKFKKIPLIFIKISKYSFGIYLLHPFFQVLIKEKFLHSFSFSYLNLIFYIVFVFIIGLTGPMLITYLLNKIPIGPYLVGKIGKDKRDQIIKGEIAS